MDQGHEELDSIWPGQWSKPMAKETNGSAWTPNSTDEPAASSRLPPRLINTREEFVDHERAPEGNSTIQLLTNNLLPHNMENPIRHHSYQAIGPYWPIHEHSSEGHKEQHQRHKTPSILCKLFIEHIIMICLINHGFKKSGLEYMWTSLCYK